MNFFSFCIHAVYIAHARNVEQNSVVLTWPFHMKISKDSDVLSVCVCLAVKDYCEAQWSQLACLQPNSLKQFPHVLHKRVYEKRWVVELSSYNIVLKK